jgi:hypothetical protein
MSLNKEIVISFIVGGIVTLLIQFFFNNDDVYESKYEQYKKRQIERDSIIAVQNQEIKELQEARSLELVYRDSLKTELDSAIVRIKELSTVKVTEETKTEALEWIQNHNSSLDR